MQNCSKKSSDLPEWQGEPGEISRKKSKRTTSEIKGPVIIEH